MKEQYKTYLIKQGYAVTTPAGSPSTVYAYIKRIDEVCDWENISWSELTNKIDSIVMKYDVGGAKEHLGNKSHKQVINALKRFADFSKQ